MRNAYFLVASLFLTGLFTATSAAPPSASKSKKRPPINLTVEVLNSTTARLSWVGSPKDEKYRLRVRPDNVLTWTYYNISAPTSTRRLSDLVPGTLYHWQVQTRFSGRDRDTSNYVTGASFTAWEPCNAPQNPLAFVNEPTRAWLTWHSDAEDAQYTVRLKKDGDKNWIAYETSNNNIWIANLEANTVYSWNVITRCVQSGLISESSETVSFNTEDGATVVVSNASLPIGAANSFSPDRLVSFDGENTRKFPVEAMLLDAMGQPVESLPVYYTTSTGTVSFDLNSELPPGLYNVSFRCGMDVQSRSVMISAQ